MPGGWHTCNFWQAVCRKPSTSSKSQNPKPWTLLACQVVAHLQLPAGSLQEAQRSGQLAGVVGHVDACQLAREHVLKLPAHHLHAHAGWLNTLKRAWVGSRLAAGTFSRTRARSCRPSAFISVRQKEPLDRAPGAYAHIQLVSTCSAHKLSIAPKTRQPSRHQRYCPGLGQTAKLHSTSTQQSLKTQNAPCRTCPA